MSSPAGESVIANEPSEDNGLTLEDWMEARDSELMNSYAPNTSQLSERPNEYQKLSRSLEVPYTANLVAESVYGGAPYAGTPSSRQHRRGRNRGTSLKSMQLSTSSSNRSKTAPMFLASSFNKQLVETKRTHTVEELRLKGELERHKKDMTLLKAQLKQRDEQLESLNEQLNKLRKEKSKALLEQENLSQGSVSSNQTEEKITVSANSKRLKNLSQPRKVRPKSSSDGIAKSYIDWIEYYGAQSPGVGDYDTDKSLKAQEARSGGKFNQSKSKSDIEWTIHHAKQMPGPGTYQYEAAGSPIKGGRISVAKVKSDIDWQIIRAAQGPGPGEYKVADGKTGGGSFSTANPKSDLEWKIYFAQKSPGPGEYKVPDAKKSGGSFSTANPKSDLEWKIYNAKQLPGAGEYNTAAPLSPSGGKFNSSKSKSDIEWKIYNAKQLPGPGQYQVKDEATRTSSHSGKFPFIYAPTDPEHTHLAKGTNAIVKMNRQKKIVMAMMNCGGPVAGGKKSLKEMTPEERLAWEKERDEDVQKTREMLERLDQVQKKRRASMENGEPLPPLNAHLLKRPTMASMLKRGINSGEVENLLGELEEPSKSPSPNAAAASPTGSLMLDIPTPAAVTPCEVSVTSTPEPEPKLEDVSLLIVGDTPTGKLVLNSEQVSNDKISKQADMAAVENLLIDQRNESQDLVSAELPESPSIQSRYCFESHTAEWVDSLDVEHLASGGFSSGNLLHSLRAPPNLKAESLLLYKLGQKVALDGDRKSHGFSETHHPHVNYYRMFKEFDLNDTGDFNLDDFTQTIRRVLGIDNSHASDQEIAMLFNEINMSGSTITLAEFAAFAKGAEHSTIYHAEKDNFGLRVASKRNSPEQRCTRNMSTDTDLASHQHRRSISNVNIPEELHAVHLVLWRLAQHCASEMDAQRPDAETHPTNPATVSYTTMFKTLDLDKAKLISREEWAFVLRQIVGIGLAVSDKELNLIYDSIHSGVGDGVTLAEFAAYARGARESTFARGAGFVWEISEQELQQEMQAAFEDLVIIDSHGDTQGEANQEPTDPPLVADEDSMSMQIVSA